MITTIIQARMSSTRLPGKVLLPLGSKSVLECVVDRVKKAKEVGSVVVATSDQPEDDRIASLCDKSSIALFRGSLSDVLDRYYQAAVAFGTTDVCRVTGDCPLIDPAVIDEVAAEYAKGECDYISTGRVSSTFPDGMDTEIFSFAALETAWKEARLQSEREHVTPYIWNHPERFRIKTLENKTDLSKYRLTLDEPNDYMLLQRVIENVQDPSMQNVISYLEQHPEVKAVNATIGRDEGYTKSLKENQTI